LGLPHKHIVDATRASLILTLFVFVLGALELYDGVRQSMDGAVMLKVSKTTEMTAAAAR